MSIVCFEGYNFFSKIRHARVVEDYCGGHLYSDFIRQYVSKFYRRERVKTSVNQRLLFIRSKTKI